METISINKADHFLGNPNATLKLLVYEDYECEYSEKAFRHLKAVRSYFKEKISIIYRNFPFTNMHPSAMKAALIVEACAIQHKFLQAHDLIFEYQDYLEYGLAAILQLLNKKYSISLEQLNEDMQKEELKQKIRNDIESAKRCALKNTPAIFINGYEYRGIIESNIMIELIKQLLVKKLLKQIQVGSKLAKVAVMDEYSHAFN